MPGCDIERKVKEGLSPPLLYMTHLIILALIFRGHRHYQDLRGSKSNQKDPPARRGEQTMIGLGKHKQL